MEGLTCQHYKCGYCKYKSNCKKKHVEGQCEALSECKEVKDCNKRHPKVCKRLLAQKFNKFGKECAYEHIQCEQKDNTNSKDVVVHEIENMTAEIHDLK